MTLDGIMADQWPDSAITRVFKLTFIQSNGYTLSQQVPVSMYSYPSGLSVCGSVCPLFRPSVCQPISPFFLSANHTPKKNFSQEY